MFALCLAQLRRSKRELAYWDRQATLQCPPVIRVLALSSLHSKAFHSIGGSIYACAPVVPSGFRGDLTGTIIALQTISDYLDTLVDRSNCLDQRVHENLHRSFVDALDVDFQNMGSLRVVAEGHRLVDSDYFAGFPFGDDGGYLDNLVRRVREGVRRLPGYAAAKDRVVRLAILYSEMQSRKHIEPAAREKAMSDWHRRNCRDPVRWWEFGAAAGSTLGIFALLALAANPRVTPESAEAVYAAYFPYVCGFHIMLDYLIDRDEDAIHGDLNFTRYYDTDDQMLEALCLFLERGRERLVSLPGAGFHQKILGGLPALYLSDRKVGRGGLRRIAGEIIRRAGPDGARFYAACRALRRVGLL